MRSRAAPRAARGRAPRGASMFSQAVSSLSRLGSWKTMPNCWRTSVLMRHGIQAVERQRPRRRAQQRREHLDASSSSGAVRAEKREDLAARHVEGDVVDRLDVAEALGEVADFDHVRGHAV